MREHLILAICLAAGCGFIPEKVTMDDPRIQPLLKAAASFDRAAHGFTPIPKSADVRFESRPTDRYDAMLHISSTTSRTISFRKTADGYRWTGEQEQFSGPKQYTTVDGTFFEQIGLTYEIELVSGAPLNKLWVNYSGEDPRLQYRYDLTLADVRPILKEWKY